MREIINYMIEANLALLLFLFTYKILLKHETRFRFMRFFMLSSILVSLLFPLMHLDNNLDTALPSMSSVVPENWLPEIVITDGEREIEQSTTIAYDLWQIVGWIYSAGAFIFFARLLLQLTKVFKTLHKEVSYSLEKFKVIESTEDIPTFSFFHVIHIGRAHELSMFEKQHIIRHEAVHARELHSLDIIIITLLQVAFWFNPFINTYKKIFVQLHEFEADARAVENSDVDKYCSLLARVALQSVHFPIANHFNHSLTLKRIEMMRTVKTTIKKWKLITLSMIVPMIFFFIACQDQLGDQISEITKNSTHVLDAPEHVQKRFAQLKSENPDKKYILLELNETASQKLQALKEEYGLPKSIEIFTTDDKNASKKASITATASDIIIEQGTSNTPHQTFSIIEFNEQTIGLPEASKTGAIFTVVEHQPEFVGGYEALKNFIQQNMKYPEPASKEGKGGTVYVSMVIDTDGTLSDAKVLRGIDPLLDAEALRVVKSLPAWIPGEQNGQKVKTRFNLPIKFDPSLTSNPIPASEISQDSYSMKVSAQTSNVNGKIIVQGSVRDENDKPLKGANIIIEGTTTGTTVDPQGNFTLELPDAKKRLVFSFIGFETKTIDF